VLFRSGYIQCGDLEVGVKTVTLVAEAVGLGAADYTVSLTLPAPTDPRIVVNALATMVRVNGTVADGNLYYRVYVDVQDAAHMLVDTSFLPPELRESDETLTATLFPAIFALIADGLPHDFYFYFWKDGAGVGAQLDQVEVNIGVGIDDSYGSGEVVTISNIRGSVTVSGIIRNDYEDGDIPMIWWGMVSPAGGVWGADDVAEATNFWEVMMALWIGFPFVWYGQMSLAEKNVRTFQTAGGSLGMYLVNMGSGVMVIESFALSYTEP
jgi:hypothetical protein